MSLNTKHDKSSFPPISSRKNASTSSGELDQSTDSFRAPESRQDNDNLCESPVFKLPTIERTKSRSISSISSPLSTLGSRQFTRDKPSRRSLCRSPSCPSNIGYSRQESSNGDLEKGIYDHFPQPEESEEDMKLPDIFRNTSPRMSPRQSSIGNKWKPDKENNYLYSLRKTESFHETSTDNQNYEHPQTHALLLPLRNVDSVSRSKNKKKKKLHKSKSENLDVSFHDRENTLGGSRWSCYENEQNQLNGSKECLLEGSLTDRQVEILSARKMKKWMKQHPSKEGQVKA